MKTIFRTAANPSAADFTLNATQPDAGHGGGTEPPELVEGTEGDDSLVGAGGDDTLRGGGGDDTLNGGGGNDVMNGGAGDDSMSGGVGDDTYVVNSAGDRVVETLGQGHDRVLADVAYTLGANLEDLTLASHSHRGGGNELANRIVGNGGDDTLSGGGGDDSLIGGVGDDVESGGSGHDDLNGGAGDDRLAAGLGDDHLSGGAGADTMSGGEGHDRLAGGIGDDQASGGEGNDSVAGEAGNDSLSGGGGDDMLDGGTGADAMAGGLGNDTYVVDDARDHVVEAAGTGSGLDTERATVSHALEDNVERLLLAGSAAIDATGNALANRIIGNAADNRIDGVEGRDTLTGGGGHDVFVFGGDNRVAGHADRVTDFASGTDKLELEHVAFTELGAAGPLDEAQFHLGSAAAAADDHLVYDQASGSLYYDADGSGAQAAQLIAQFGAGTVLAASDFVIS